MADNLTRLDPRARRTRILLRTALIDLITEREEYGSITIKDITDRADVSRTTFYLHFKDVDQLLFDTMRDLYMEILEIHEADPLRFDASGSEDFEHVAQFADLYRVLLSEQGSQAFTVRVRNFLAEFLQDWLVKNIPPGNLPDVPLEMVAYYMAGAQIGVIYWWLENDMPLTPQEMGLKLYQLCAEGIGNGGGENWACKAK